MTLCLSNESNEWKLGIQVLGVSGVVHESSYGRRVPRFGRGSIDLFTQVCRDGGGRTLPYGGWREETGNVHIFERISPYDVKLRRWGLFGTNYYESGGESGHGYERTIGYKIESKVCQAWIACSKIGASLWISFKNERKEPRPKSKRLLPWSLTDERTQSQRVKVKET